MAGLPTVGSTKALERIEAKPAWWQRLLGPAFARVGVDSEARERLADAQQRGLVVHTLRVRRLVDPLFLIDLLSRCGLETPKWRHDHFSADLGSDPASLLASLDRGEAALMFLRQPRTLMNPTTAYSQEHVEALLALQRRSDRPILLLPSTILWTKRAIGLQKTIIDATFGDRDAPGKLREIAGFLWHLGDSQFHVGAPVDLRAVLEREKGTADRVIAKKVRWAILNHLTREEQIRTGPMQRSAARTRQMVLKDSMVRKYISTHSNPEALEKKADTMVKTIAADMRYGWLRVLDAVVDVVWHRIYDGIVVDEAGLSKVKEAARRGPIVLVPSHKSHIDYLVLSQVFFKASMMPPHIAAGENLNFWPLGYLFRRSGAFFIRRSFKGDKLYTLVFAAYVHRLMKEGTAIEFFIEGGRSRTGKLLQPRLGMLTMCVDPVIEGRVHDMSYVPVSISYEKVVEAKSYAKELQGGAKKKEDVGSLLSTANVLRSKYGRVYVDFSEPLSLRSLAASRGVDLDAASLDNEKLARRNLVRQLGHQLIYNINEVTRVTPTSVAALLLLARHRRGLAEAVFSQRADRLLQLLGELDARISTTLDPDTRQAALRQAMGRFAAEGLIHMTPAKDGTTVFQIPDAGRCALDYYRNNIIHYFVPLAIVAAAVRAQGDEPAPDELVKQRARRLSRILKGEFSFRVDAKFEDNFDEASQHLLRRRTLATKGEGAERNWVVSPQGRAEAEDLADLLGVFLEGFRFVADALGSIETKGMGEKRLIDLMMVRGNRRFLEGEVHRAEAVTQPIVRAALGFLRAEGILAGSKIIEILDDSARRAVVAELEPYID